MGTDTASVYAITRNESSLRIRGNRLRVEEANHPDEYKEPGEG
jgi:hypothetical protein